jgi:hypothetical protein
MSQAQNKSPESLEQLLRHEKIWRAGEASLAAGISTNFPVLDSLLPSHGWPQASLIEILTAQEGIGSLRLVLPAIAQLTQTQWAIWVCPPYVPYAPALQAAGVVLERLLIVEPDTSEQADLDYVLWVFEQALRFVDCGIAMAWIGIAQYDRLRRLQLACEQGQTCGVMFRPESLAIQPSPAVLRLSLTSNADSTSVRILKSQGGVRNRNCQLVL